MEGLTLKRCLEFAVATEELGTKVYTNLAKKFSGTKDISDLFSHLAADEQIHARQFSEYLGKAPAEKGIPEASENHAYLMAMSMSAFFSNREGLFLQVEKVQNRNDALQVAFDFEKATLGFYRAIEDVLGKQEPLGQVIETERNHVVVLMKALLVDGSAFRGLQDMWP